MRNSNFIKSMTPKKWLGMVAVIIMAILVVSAVILVAQGECVSTGDFMGTKLSIGSCRA